MVSVVGRLVSRGEGREGCAWSMRAAMRIKAGGLRCVWLREGGWT